jgi:hypothetical protein
VPECAASSKRRPDGDLVRRHRRVPSRTAAFITTSSTVTSPLSNHLRRSPATQAPASGGFGRRWALQAVSSGDRQETSAAGPARRSVGRTVRGPRRAGHPFASHWIGRGKATRPSGSPD